MTNAKESLWGIDLGGTKIECVVLESASNPAVIERRRIPTNAKLGYSSVLKNIRTLVNDITKDTQLRPEKLGMGTPGSIDPFSGLLRGSNSMYLQHQPIGEDLSSLLGIPVIVENDANCFVLAETRMGVVRELPQQPDTVFGVIMGTGVGGGLVVHNRIVNGRNRITGEWGHNYLDNSGGPCYCGKSGCVETVVSGPALENFYLEKSGNHLPLEEINQRASGGDINAMLTIERLIHFFALGLSTVINTVDPDVVVIGGGVGNIDRIYSDGVKELEKYVFAPRISTPVVKPLLGDSAGVFGAAFLSV